MKKRCFALLLALSLLLTGCSPLFDLYSAFRGEYTRPDYSDGAISYREFQRPYQPRVKYTAEPDIEYVRRRPLQHAQVHRRIRDRRQGRCGRHHQPVRRGL
mgnify:CR=1 FL=1